MIIKAVNKPIEIEAILFNGLNHEEIFEFTNHKATYSCSEDDIAKYAGDIIIPTLEGGMTATDGDFIIKGVNGEFYLCKPDIFEKTYDIIGESK